MTQCPAGAGFSKNVLSDCFGMQVQPCRAKSRLSLLTSHVHDGHGSSGSCKKTLRHISWTHLGVAGGENSQARP